MPAKKLYEVYSTLKSLSGQVSKEY